MTRRMASARITGLMEDSTQECGKMESRTEKVLIDLKTVKLERESGKMARGQNGWKARMELLCQLLMKRND